MGIFEAKSSKLVGGDVAPNLDSDPPSLEPSIHRLDPIEDPRGDLLQSEQQAYELAEAGLTMEKSWLAPGDGKDCDVCATNAEAGWIPLSGVFPSGHPRPLAHEGCRCDALYQRKPKK